MEANVVHQNKRFPRISLPLGVGVVNYDGDNELKNIKDASKSIFAGACDEEGNLLTNGDNPEYNIDMFVIEI